MIVALRNCIISFFYKIILKPVLFRIDPEVVHDTMIRFGAVLGKYGITRGLTRMMFFSSHPSLEQHILGIKFTNPIGLAAGFDKNAELTDILPAVGFGFAEVGSITGEQCNGNPKPRLWRIPEKKSLRVYYGLKNDGAEAISQKLEGRQLAMPIGVSVAKTNCQATIDTQAGIADYIKAAEAFQDIGSYVTINISCPNTFGGQPFTDPEKLEQLLTAFDKLNLKKPVFLKLSPNLTLEEIDAIIATAKQHKIDGFICSNLSKKQKGEKGGLSGKAVEADANALIRHIYTQTNGEYVIIGCGGVFTAADAYNKIRAGASLIQLITGMIYLGPQQISEINRGLVQLLRKDGYSSISEIIGIDNK